MTNQKTIVTVFGAEGRMGKTILSRLPEDFSVAGEVEHDTPFPQTMEALAKSDVAIDFTTPYTTQTVVPLAEAHKTALVIGTTGMGPKEEEMLKRAAKIIPIVYASNMSIGVTVLTALTEQVAALLGPDYDIEIVEMHHRHKIDAPSGTALTLGKAASKGRNVALQNVQAPHRHGDVGPRPNGEIGFAVLRGGDVAGDHTVYFAGEGERLELTHRASNRSVFADGAIRAARWVVKQPPGLYSMRDVLGL